MEKTSCSLWAATSPGSPQRTSLSGDLEADVAIVGGGICGLTTAYLLRQSGLRIVVLEANRVGHGTTGNSTGNLYEVVDQGLRQLRKKWGDEVLRQVVASRRHAISFIETLNLDCDLVNAAFCHFAEETTEDIARQLDEELEAMRAAGLNAVRTAELGLPFPVTSGLKLEGQAQFHPLKYVQGLAAQLGPTQIYENSPVLDYDDDEGVLRTPAGKVRSQRVVFATHTPKGVHPAHFLLSPSREFGVAAELPQGVLPTGIYWRADTPKRSLRVYRDYAIVIGESYKTGQNEQTAESVAALEDFLRAKLPIGAVQYRWAAQAYVPADGLPMIGQSGERSYVATGFATDGLVYGTLAGILLANLLQGKSHEFADLYRADRVTPGKSARQFLSEAADNLGQYLKDIPGVAEAKEFSEIGAGEGKLLEREGEKLAVYRSPEGNLHVLSAVCTHMKCIVRWNEVERSWDCPCHGSRFSPQGQVLEGPALVALEKKEISDA